MLEPYLDVARNLVAGKPIDRRPVLVQPQEKPAWAKSFRQGEGIATASQGGVYERLPRRGSKAFYYLF